MTAMPRMEGPIPCSEASHPFCAMAYSRVPLRVEDYGYAEEEYFLSGTANIYDVDANDEPIISKPNVPYQTRILIRKPQDMRKFSGRVYIDILNATQNYDIEDLWHRAYLWCMEHGHGYVGITAKPVNALSLKRFDYERYESLNWASGETVPQPAVLRYATIPGTEEGLVWDMLGQVCNLVRHGGAQNGFNGAVPDYVYLTGQSQSGAYLNAYVHYFDHYAPGMPSRRLYDGYCNIVRFWHRKIKQERTLIPLKFYKACCLLHAVCIHLREGGLRFLRFYEKGDFLERKIPNRTDMNAKSRYYEFPGAPHIHLVCPVLTDIEEIRKTGQTLPNLDERLLKTLSDIPMEYYICGLLEKLHIWASQGIAPEIVQPIARKGRQLLRDEHGNAVGGLRSPFLDVPIATYVACNPDDPEGISGKMTYFSKEKFIRLYQTKENYLKTFAAYVDRQREDGWVDSIDAQKMKAWAENAVQKRYA